MLESALIGFASSFAATLFYALAEKGVKHTKANQDFNRQLKDAVRQATEFVLHEDIGLQDAKGQIVNAIWDNRRNHQIVNDTKTLDAISQILEQHEEINISANELLTRIVAAIPGKVASNPELSTCITLEMLLRLEELGKEILDAIGYNDTGRKKPNKANLLQKQFEINQRVYIVLNQRSKRVANSRFLPDAYRNYFTRGLFLEKSLPDGQQATLCDTYIRPKFQIMDFTRGNAGKEFDDIKEFIIDFVHNNLREFNYGTRYSYPSSDINTLFIKGHPGSGKSSLFYFLAYEKSHSNDFLSDKTMYFIRLVELLQVNGNKLSEDDPLSDIVKHLNIKQDSLVESIIVLDGLDEICAVRDIDIETYCRNLINSCCGFQGLKIIITTRQNYVNIRNIDNKNVINISLSCLSISDLERWASYYFRIHGSCVEQQKTVCINLELLKKSEDSSLLSIVAIPLLFYMIVAMKISLSEISNIGELYDAVFDELTNRNYNENSNDALQRHAVEHKISPKLARQIAREIAYMMYKRNTLLLKISDDELRTALDEAQGYLEQKHIQIEYSDKTQVEKLFAITFFYKQSDDIVEFAHKSIMEYFAAEKLYELLENSTKPIVDVLYANFINLPITLEIAAFLKSSFARKHMQPEQYTRLNKEIGEFFITSLEKGDMQLVCDTRDSFCFDYGKHIHRVFWFFIKDVFKDIDVINSYLSHPNAKIQVRNALITKPCSEYAFLDLKANPVDFSECCLDDYRFNFCELLFINFSKSKLWNTTFIRSILDACMFEKCDFSNTDLTYSYIKNVVFSSSQDRVSADFSFSILEDTVFDSMDLSKVLFKNATFSHVEAKGSRFYYDQIFDLSSRGLTISGPEICILFRMFPDELIKEAFRQGKNKSEISAFLCEAFELPIKQKVGEIGSVDLTGCKIIYDLADINSGLNLRMNK